ncbi:MAG: hypothetical protein R3Y39_04895, partial [Rikenellaceae bacterium]
IPFSGAKESFTSLPSLKKYFISFSATSQFLSCIYKLNSGFENIDVPLPWLFNVEEDPSESENIAAENPEIVAELQAIINKQITTVKKAPSQFDREE